MINQVAFGKRIKKYREALSWSQRELARRSGVRQSRISLIESGAPALDVEVEKLAETFGMSVVQLTRKSDLRPVIVWRL